MHKILASHNCLQMALYKNGITYATLAPSSKIVHIAPLLLPILVDSCRSCQFLVFPTDFFHFLLIFINLSLFLSVIIQSGRKSSFSQIFWSVIHNSLAFSILDQGHFHMISFSLSHFISITIHEQGRADCYDIMILQALYHDKIRATFSAREFLV